jgi:hypothetical protein
MNKHHDAKNGNWLRRHASAAVVGAVVMIGTAGWIAQLGTREVTQPVAVPATHADSPRSYVEKSTDGRGASGHHEVAGEKTGTSVALPPMPTKTSTTTVSPVAAPLPTVEYRPAQVSVPLPSIEAGPELSPPITKPAAASETSAASSTQPSTKLASAPEQPPIVATTTLTVANISRPPSPISTSQRSSANDGPKAVTANLPAAAPQPARSEAMEMIARQADEKVREGMELADRGASFAARADFIAALRILAQGLDNDTGTPRHSQSLSAALTAMKEAQDFLPAGGKVEGELDLPPLVAGHRTPLLKNVPPGQLQAMRALKQYFNFAQEQLCQAVSHEVSGSMALSALGKLHAALADKANAEVALPEAKAITFFQAAILVCPQNYMAANDLGVLLAHKNDCAAARKALEHSVTICRCTENLRNLSVVYRQLGETRLAELAARDAEAARAAEVARQRSGGRSTGGAVQWVDQSAFAKPSGQWTDLPARPAANAAATQGPTAANPATPTAAPMIR